MTLLILAAGLGSRYGGTKQFDGVGPEGEFLLEYTVYDAIRAGFKRVVLVTRNELVQEITIYFKERIPPSLNFECIPQSIEDVPEGFIKLVDRVKPWGTAHAIWCSRRVIQGKFVMVNADDLYGRKAIEAGFRLGGKYPKKGCFGLVGYELKETLSKFGTVSRGICRTRGNCLMKVTEYTQLAKEVGKIVDKKSGESFNGNEVVSMNLWVLDASIFPEIEKDFLSFFEKISRQQSGELYLPQVIQSLIDANVVTVNVVPGDGEWHGMTHKEDKVQLANELSLLTKKGIYPTPLWN
ncbi:MAG: sugar phosphate nucleotidyltransferase [Cyclobacteriaceae bacterium]